MEGMDGHEGGMIGMERGMEWTEWMAGTGMEVQ